MVNWDAEHLLEAFSTSGFTVSLSTETETSQLQVTSALLERWFAAKGEGARPSYAQHLRRRLSPAELRAIRALFEGQLLNQAVPWQTHVAFLFGAKERE